MAVTAGALSQISVGPTNDSLLSGPATAGTGPYTYQWYRSTTTAFTPGAGNLIAGATGLTLNDSGLIPNTVYYYKVIATDTGAGNATSTSAQLAVTTAAPSLSQNAFVQSPFVGIVDMATGSTNVFAASIDPSIGAGVAYCGQAVKIVPSTKGGLPSVVPCVAKNDPVIGFIRFNVKDLQYTVGQMVEVCFSGTIVWLYATGPITQFAQVCLDTTSPGAVQAAGNSATAVGLAFDGAAAAGSLIRVLLLANSTYAVA